jgi:hypothetical protein
MAATGDSLAVLFSELVEGPKGEAFMLNPGDAGLLKSLDLLSAASASTRAPGGGASIAAHVDHVLYGLHLMNQWAAGEEDPWSDADWTASWERGSVSDEEWAALREQLRIETGKWRKTLAELEDLEGVELNGVIGIVAHLAYHLGAIRQIDRSLGGPSAEASAT